MPSAPLIAAAFAASIVTCFAPEQDCAGLVTGAIDAAGHEILVNAYAFTTGSGIPAALNRAHDRRVDVRLVADRRALANFSRYGLQSVKYRCPRRGQPTDGPA